VRSGLQERTCGGRTLERCCFGFTCFILVLSGYPSITFYPRSMYDIGDWQGGMIPRLSGMEMVQLPLCRAQGPFISRMRNVLTSILSAFACLLLSYINTASRLRTTFFPLTPFPSLVPVCCIKRTLTPPHDPFHHPLSPFPPIHTPRINPNPLIPRSTF
jgi:hypothetical protein